MSKFINSLRTPPRLIGGGISTGFAELDERTGGLRPGHVTLLAGRPSVRVQRLAFNILAHVAGIQRIECLLIEQPKGDEGVDATLLSCGRGTSLSAYREPMEEDTMDYTVIDNMEWLRTLPLVKCDDAGRWLPGWARMVLPTGFKIKPKVLVVGPLLRVDAEGMVEYSSDWTASERASAMLHALKFVARTEGIAVLAYTYTDEPSSLWGGQQPPSARFDEDVRLFPADTLMYLERAEVRTERAGAPLPLTPGVLIRVMRTPEGRTGWALLEYEREYARYWSIGKASLPWTHGRSGKRRHRGAGTSGQGWPA